MTTRRIHRVAGGVAAVITAVVGFVTLAHAQEGPTAGSAADAAELQLPAGTVVSAVTVHRITSRHNEVGDLVTARFDQAVLRSDGAVVIPAGAELQGIVSMIEPEEEDELLLTFFGIVIDGITHPIQARVISLPTREKRRGNAAGDAAKVGAGAVVGGIAGRIIGGNSEGTIIGAITGAAAGAGTAVATRTDDVVVDAGTVIRLQLTAPFRRR